MIDFEELVYTNVEADVSLTGRTGFQVLTSSPGVTELEKTEAPNRLFYRPSRAEEDQGEYQEKHVFYRTRSDNFLLARIIRLPEPDTAGRTGRYLAHALLISPQNFARLGNDPCPILRWFDGFFVTVQDAVDAQLSDPEMHRSRRAKIDLEFWRQMDEAVTSEQARVKKLDLPAEMRRDLYLLSLQHAHDEGSRNALGFLGNPTLVLDQFSALFALLPDHARAKCSFDTFFRNGNLGSTPYWAVGLPPGSASSPRLFTFDIASRFFKYARDAKTPFEIWSARRVETDPVDYAGLAEAAWKIFGWISTDNQPIPVLKQQAIARVWNTLLEDPEDQRQITQHLYSILGRRLKSHQIGPTLAQEIIKRKIAGRPKKENSPDPLADVLLELYHEQWSDEELNDIIGQIFESAVFDSSSPILSEIGSFAMAAKNFYLYLVVCHAVEKIDGIKTTIDKMMPVRLNVEYRSFVSYVLRPSYAKWMIGTIGDATFLGFEVKSEENVISNTSYAYRLWETIFHTAVFSAQEVSSRWAINMQQIAEKILETSPSLSSMPMGTAIKMEPYFRQIEDSIAMQRDYGILYKEYGNLMLALQDLEDDAYAYYVNKLLNLIPAQIDVYASPQIGTAFHYGFALTIEPQSRFRKSKAQPELLFHLCNILIGTVGQNCDPVSPNSTTLMSTTRWLQLMFVLANRYRYQPSRR